MRFGTRNRVVAKVTSVKKGDVLSVVKFEVLAVAEMTSVVTNEALADLRLKKGDEVFLVIRPTDVMPVKD